MAKEMFELFENDIPCPLDSELGLRRADKNWEPLEVIPGIKVNYSDFGQLKIEGLEYDTKEILDYEWWFTDNCN